MEPYALDAPDAQRGERSVVLEAAELALDRAALPVQRPEAADSEVRGRVRFARPS